MDNSINSALSSDPLADPITKIVSGAHHFKLLETAISLGIFDNLEMCIDPVSAEILAKKHGFNVDKLSRFLDALCSLNLIGKTTCAKGKFLYYNTPGTSKYLTRSRKQSLVPLVLMEQNMILPLMDKLTVGLKNDYNINIMSNKDGVDSTKMPTVGVDEKNNNNINTNQTNGIKAGVTKNGMNALEQQMKFIMCMDSFSAPCASALSRAFDVSMCKTAVDLGGGSGMIGLEFAKRYPEMDIKILDLPHVTQIAKKMNPVTPDNATYVSKNFFEDDIPKSDLYILSHVIHDWDDASVHKLLNKLYNEMQAGSQLLILEKILEPQKDGPEIAAVNNLILSMLTHGKERNEHEYRALLSSHGFSSIAVRRLSGYNTYDAILTQKPS